MSIPSAICQTIVNSLQSGSRQLLTFSTKSSSDTTPYAVACLFVNNSQNPFSVLPMSSASAQAQVNNMLVYNLVSLRLETLDGSLCCYASEVIGGMGSVNVHPVTSTVSTTEQFFITGQGLLTYTGVSPAPSLYAFRSANLLFCTAGNSFCPSVQSSNITLLNWITLRDLNAKVGSVQDTNGKNCCYNDDVSRVKALLLWDRPMGQAQRLFPVFSSQLLCQQDDKTCVCPANKLCWMYNATNPCCVQGNPLDPPFSASSPPLYTTQSQTECESQAINCSQWRFNTVDVPCCIQRSPLQWSTAGYSNVGLQMFNTKTACDAAAASQCNFQTLLNAPVNVNDYYGLILESKFTEGCETLRAAGTYGSSANCDLDANKLACQYGNCTQNYCGPWAPSSTNPYAFNQDVLCLPSPEQCGADKLCVSNPGQPTVSSSCKNQCI